MSAIPHSFIHHSPTCMHPLALHHKSSSYKSSLSHTHILPCPSLSPSIQSTPFSFLLFFTNMEPHAHGHLYPPTLHTQHLQIHFCHLLWAFNLHVAYPRFIKVQKPFAFKPRLYFAFSLKVMWTPFLSWTVQRGDYRVPENFFLTCSPPQSPSCINLGGCHRQARSKVNSGSWKIYILFPVSSAFPLQAERKQNLRTITPTRALTLKSPDPGLEVTPRPTIPTVARLRRVVTEKRANGGHGSRCWFI